jgi:hypothetical protein
MTYEELINAGIEFRERTEPEQALACFGQAFIQVPDSAAAFNNYGNTLREMGQARRAIPFLQHACILDPGMSTAQFNLAVAMLISGDAVGGFKQYESRWNFEHLANTLPKYSQPRWIGQALPGKTIFVLGEQGFGDNIQFVRYLPQLRNLGATVHCHIPESLITLLSASKDMHDIHFSALVDPPEHFDYWSPIMSLPVGFGTDYTTMSSPLQYLDASQESVTEWRQRLGPKTRQRIGVCWSGRRDTWINRHKAVTFESIVDLIRRNPDLQWINLQSDADEEQNTVLTELGVVQYPGTIRGWNDTAGLIHHLDMVVGVDTAVTHLSCALGRPTWVMLSQFALDWRWLLDRDDSPWYPSAKLFRQPVRGDWASVVNKITQYLSWWKN